MKNIVCFIEKVDKETGYLLLDFPPKGKTGINYFEIFLETIGLEPINQNAYMLQIKGVNFLNYKAPREGLYYKMPKELLSKSLWLDYNDANDNEITNYIAFKVNLNNQILNFGYRINENKFRIENKKNKIIWNARKLIKIEIKKANKFKFWINNIGQGSFNEICIDEHYHLLFDFGSRQSNLINIALEKTFKFIVRQNKLNEINNKERIKLYLILSHWDIDHYNGLLKLDSSFIEMIELFVVPKVLPSQTSEDAFAKIPIDKVILIPELPKIKKSGIRLKNIFDNEYLKLYRASKSSNRNTGGVVLTFHGNEGDVIFSADQHYNLIDKFIFNKGKHKSKYLVVPHHGGYAGNIKHCSNWELQNIIISAGDNPWEHPIESIKDYFKSKGSLFITKVEKKNYFKEI